MAKIKNGLISGRVGPVEYYVINGVQYVRSRAAKVRQTKKTKQSAKIFGASSQIGKVIRDSIAAELPIEPNVKLMSSFTSKVFQSMTRQWNECEKQFNFVKDGFKDLKGFEFDPDNPVSRFLRNEPKVHFIDDRVILSFDEIDISRDLKFPKNSLRCDFSICLSLLKPEEALKVRLAEKHVKTIRARETTVEAFDIAFTLPENCLCVITMFIKYYKTGAEWRLVNNKSFNPGYVCTAAYTIGSQYKDDKRKWSRTTQIKGVSRR